MNHLKLFLIGLCALALIFFINELRQSAEHLPRD
jgi:hypothetical protein